MLKSIDILDCDYKFTYEKTNFRTTLGGIITVIMGFGIIILVWYFGNDIYFKEEPIFIKKSNESDYFPKVVINNSNLFFGMKIDDFYSNNIDDPRFFEIFATYNFYENNNETGENVEIINKDLLVEKCNQGYLDKSADAVPMLGKYYCANYTNSDVGGEFAGSENIGIINFFVKKCDKETELKFNVTCATIEEVENKFGGFVYISYYAQKNHIDPKNHFHPIQKSYGYDYDIISLTGHMYQRMYYSQSEISTDEGWIFSDNRLKDFIEYDKTRYGYSTRTPTNGVIYNASFQISRQKNYYSRVYIKMQDIAAVVGGFMKLAIVLINIVFSFYIKNAYFLFLYNKLLNLEIDEKSLEIQNKVLLSKNNSLELIKINNNVNVNGNINVSGKGFLEEPVRLDIPKEDNNNLSIRSSYIYHKPKIVKENNLNPEVIELLKYKNKIRTRVKMNFIEQFKYIYCSCKLKDNSIPIKRYRHYLLLQAEKEISKKMDIVHLIKKQDQFDLLTKISLNKNQCFMLKNRDLKSIVKEFEIEKPKKVKSEEKRLKDIQDLKEYIKNKYYNRAFTNTDKLLISYLDDNIKKDVDVNNYIV